MAHFAKIDPITKLVTSVTVGRQEDDGKEAELSARTGDVYKQTSFNTFGGVHELGGIPFRKNFAGIGYTFDEARDAFIAPKPFESWLLNEETCLWNAPAAMPEDGKLYAWNEDQLAWVELN